MSLVPTPQPWPTQSAQFVFGRPYLRVPQAVARHISATTLRITTEAWIIPAVSLFSMWAVSKAHDDRVPNTKWRGYIHMP